MCNSIYDFEGGGRRKLSEEEVDSALEEFGNKLGFEISDILEYKDDLVEYIINHHKLISRYQELRRNEQMKRSGFVLSSFFLLIFIPVGFSVWSKNDPKNAELIMAALTSLLAIQKSMSSWLDKRKVIGGFWKAESDIKSLLYEFEGKWENKAHE